MTVDFPADVACHVPTEASPRPLSPSFLVVPAEPTATTRSMTDGSPKGAGARNKPFPSHNLKTYQLKNLQTAP